MTPDNSFTFRVLASVLGGSTGDPLLDQMNTATLMGARRLAEMNEVGFYTNNLFDFGYLEQHLAEARPFLLTSAATSTVYLAVCNEQVGNAFRVGVQVYHAGEVNDKFWKMTLVRHTNGSIRANAGW